MFGRLRCHFCGTRSRYSRGTTEFQCTECEALNFFDAKGEVAEPPTQITDPPQAEQRPRSTSPYSISRPASQDEQQESIFCQRCLNNQRMYIDALNSYLPDEDHPRYEEYVDKLPQRKADLEKKYPQVCTKCAPKVQERIYQADYRGMSQSAAIAMSKTRARRGHSPVGQRDDWRKWCMRLLLTLCGLALYANLLVQAAWHAYGMGMSVFGATPTDDQDVAIPLMFEPTARDCLKQAALFRFDMVCHELFAGAVPGALIASFLLLWYNPGLTQWYHHTHRIEAIYGQTEYFRLQVILLCVRYIAWYKMSDFAFVVSLSTEQSLAAHGFMLAFLSLGQWVGNRCITTEKWKIRGKIMPRPTERDVFGAAAGPADEHYARLASSTHPLKLFARDQKPFPIEVLAPNSQKKRGYSRLDLPSMPPPSPPDTDSVSGDEGEAMDLDPPPSRTAGMPGKPIDRTFRPQNYGYNGTQTRSLYNHGTTQPSGWGAMRSEVFGIQDQVRSDDERKRMEEEERAKLKYQPPVELSPFRGRLPQAPMSVGRRLRNPPTQVTFKQTPLSKQQDFMQQMRDSFEHGKTFGPKTDVLQSRHVKRAAPGRFEDEDDEEFSPAKSRTRGALDLKPGAWHLPGDGQQTTGLEELLGGTGFAIADESDVRVAAAPGPQSGRPFSWLLPLSTAVLLGMVGGWNVEAIRRPICLWLVSKMEELGI